MKKHNWCEYWGYTPNENLEMMFEIEAEEYIKKCIRKNKRKFGENYTQKDLIIDEELQEIKNQLFGRSV